MTINTSPLNHISAVIFDMDGLMFDTEQIARLAWKRAASDFGYHLSERLFLSLVGRTVGDVRALILEAFGAETPFDEMLRRKQDFVQRYTQESGVPHKPGLLELLAQIEALGWSKAVASSSTCVTIERYLALAGVSPERFAAIVGGDEVKNGKPAPDIFLAAAETLDIPPRRCLVLEDSNPGIEAAYLAGMTPVMVPDMLPPTEESRRMAYRILPSLEAVRELLP